MGAVTAIRYLHLDDSISGVIADSPFRQLRVLLRQVIAKRMFIPEFIVDPLLGILFSEYQQKSGLDLNNCQALSSASKTKTPILFIYSQNDELLTRDHLQVLFQKTNSMKQLLFVPGNHNSTRSGQTINLCIDFISNRCSKIKKVSRSTSRRKKQTTGFRSQLSSPVSRIKRAEKFRVVKT